MAMAFSIDSQAQTNFQTVRNFGFTALATGSHPYSQVIQGTDHSLYGTAQSGGASDLGVVYKMNTDGSGYTVLHSFSGNQVDGTRPEGKLLLASDGRLYGTTYNGGTYNLGTIFGMDATGANYKVLRSLNGSDGVNPFAGLTEGREDGMLYGTASFGGANNYYGTVFGISKDGTTFSVLESFTSNTGGSPYAGVLEGADGYLYTVTVTTPAYLVKISRSGGLVSQHFFSFTQGAFGDGGNPIGTPVQGPDGTIYGTTQYGGNYMPVPGSVAFGVGTIYKINPDFSGYQVIHRYPADGSEGYFPSAGLVFGTDGNLYGETTGYSTNQGTFYKIDTNGTTLTVLHTLNGNEGTSPMGNMIQGADGAFYATAFSGGDGGNGTVVKLAGTNASVIHQFASDTGGDGSNPYAAVLFDGTEIYGSTQSGGSVGNGVIFKIKSNGMGYAILHDFTGDSSDGQISAPMIKGTDGYLYGTLPNGGSNDFGAVFKISTNGDNYTLLHEFSASPDGAAPQAVLVQGPDGFLYGTTQYGGDNGDGTVFKLDTNGNNYSVLYSFAGFVPPNTGGGGDGGGEENLKPRPAGLDLGTIDGRNPMAAMIFGQDGLLYGTTSSGGNNLNAGTVFQISTDGSFYNDLYNFNDGPDDGANLKSPLVQAANGILYGTSAGGGSNYSGTVFSMDTNGNFGTLLYQFGSGSDGQNPQGALVLVGNTLYGTTQSGGSVFDGTVFSIQTNGAAFTTLHDFTDAEANTPYSGLTLAPDGSLFGTGSYGGTPPFGAIFKLFSRKGVISSIPATQVSGQSMMVNFTGGLPNQTYSIQASPNALTGWSTIGSAMADGNGLFQFMDSDSTNHTVRFYRSYGP
ncbi:MAG TPA: choice-of-anchor tandem repeat GloVer-containing protein [Verrucomicrobiae bacterium]|nr:choice-of-anchor tandem repeat GloVer-containing protein [Verrucomicrobiae bacterium]